MKPVAILFLCLVFVTTAAQGVSFRSSGCYMQKQLPNCQDSIVIFNDLLKSEPTNAYYYYMRARHQDYCREIETAIRSCDTAIALDSTQPVVFRERCRLYLHIGMLRNALQDAQKAVLLDTTDERSWCMLASAYGNFKVYDSVLPTVEKALRIKPDYYDALCVKAQRLKQLKRYNEAIAELNKAVKIDAKDSYAYHIRVGAYGGSEKYKEAIADIDKVLSIDSCYTELYYYKGNYFYHLNKLDSAMKWYTISIDKHPRSVYSYYYRGWLYDKKEEKEKAAEDFLQAALLGHDDAVRRLERDYPLYYTKYLEIRKKQ